MPIYASMTNLIDAAIKEINDAERMTDASLAAIAVQRAHALATIEVAKQLQELNKDRKKRHLERVARGQ